MQFPHSRLRAVFKRSSILLRRLTLDIGAWTHINEERTQPYYDMQVKRIQTWVDVGMGRYFVCPNRIRLSTR